MAKHFSYFCIAQIYRVFSINRWTRRLYRWLANQFGQGRHSRVAIEEIEQGLWVAQWASRSAEQTQAGGCPVGLELGTGWTHFYGLFLACCMPYRLTLFDIQDNRQLRAFKQRTANLTQLLNETTARDGTENQYMGQVLQKLSKAENWSTIYSVLNAEYCLEPEGKLDQLTSNEFDFVFSVDVLEHIARSQLEDLAKSLFRIIKPGGMTAHQVGLDDHYAHSVPGIPSKYYLRFSEDTWRYGYESQLQFINRLQSPEYIMVFKQAGFELVECFAKSDIHDLQKISPDRAFVEKYPQEILSQVRCFLVFRKPKSMAYDPKTI